MESSPTGKPLVPTKTVPLLTLIVALGGVFATFDFFPETKVDEKVGAAIIAVGAALGIASPGMRKRE